MVITVSRQYAAGGSEVARRIAEALDWAVVDNEFIEQVAARAGLPPEEVAKLEERVPTFVERLARTMATTSPELFPPETGTVEDLEEVKIVRITETVVGELAEQGRVVLVGRAAPAVLGLRTDGLHVKVVAPESFRLRVAIERLGLDSREAEDVLRKTDSNRARYHRQHYRRDWDDPTNYDMVLNSERLGFDGAAAVVVDRVRSLGWAARPDGGNGVA